MGVDLFREKLLFLISTPLYAFFIGLEMILSYVHHRRYYSSKGLVMNFYLMLLNFGLDVLLRTFVIVLLDGLLPYKFFSIPTPWIYWTVLLIAEDFMFYWLHRVDHYCRLFWAVHVTHHSSEEFNLTVGFRSSVFQPLYRFVWFLPLPLMGFKGADIMLMYAITQIYGILIHTQYIGKLGPLEWILSTPSHHRVHHASNPEYLDRNMGMVLIIWDRMFGTFTPESDRDPVRYGLTENLQNPYDPVNTVFHEWKNIGRDLRKPATWKAKFMYIFGPPGWSHDGSKKTSNQMRAEWRNRQQKIS